MNRLAVAGWVLAAALAGAVIAGTYGNRVGAQGGIGYGWWGPGMMGPGMFGPGMMGQGTRGPGLSAPWMIGPGMMAPGMMGPWMMSPWMMGPGMMGYGWGPLGPGGQQSNLNLSASDVKSSLERWIAMAGNSRIKVGNVSEKDASTITADIVTADKEALVQRFSVDRRTGFFSSAE